MINVSGFGTGIVIDSASSFPMGFSLSKFADDESPISSKELEPFGYEMLYDGGLFAFDKAAPLEVSVSVIAGSEDDINLRILLNSKKGSFRFLPGIIPDMTTLVATLPDGGRTVLSNGTIIKGPAIDTIQNNGRRKGNTYTFVFGSYLGAQTARQAISNVIQSVLEVV